eukprot:237259_1
MTASKSSSPPPIEIAQMILYPSYEQTAAANGWDNSSNEGGGDIETTEDEEYLRGGDIETTEDEEYLGGGDIETTEDEEYLGGGDIETTEDGKNGYDFNGDNDAPNDEPNGDAASKDDFKGDNDEKNRNDNKGDHTTLKGIQIDDENENTVENDKDKMDNKDEKDKDKKDKDVHDDDNGQDKNNEHSAFLTDFLSMPLLEPETQPFDD